MLAKIQASPSFVTVWKCWYVPNDATSVVKIIQNFPTRDIRRAAVLELCQLTGDKPQVEGLVKCGGTKVLLDSLQVFRTEEDLVQAGLRALWNISFGNDDNTQEIIEQEGLELIIQLMQKFSNCEDVCEYSNVLLYNMSLSAAHVARFPVRECVQGILSGMRKFSHSEVVLKFGFGALANLCKCSDEYIAAVLDLGGVEMLIQGMTDYPNNEYLNEHCIAFINHCSAYKPFAEYSAMRQVVTCSIAAIEKYQSNKHLAKHGNNALWNLGNNIRNRVTICESKSGLAVIANSIHMVAEDCG
eukprot:NODE_716_length_1688_cov_80.510570_g706_i0.p1 GENE.NODE_716_length_1688_cov_80.510570_g706_i0~~NODE_716_length_1688_cov_80.510570_g706_i0.p1  ORF type:complete len:300 (-),score=90.65 NODE_716_length_1688_cov_80.510570_g706_i0:53-952(-)